MFPDLLPWENKFASPNDFPHPPLKIPVFSQLYFTNKPLVLNTSQSSISFQQDKVCEHCIIYILWLTGLHSLFDLWWPWRYSCHTDSSSTCPWVSSGRRSRHGSRMSRVSELPTSSSELASSSLLVSHSFTFFVCLLVFQRCANSHFSLSNPNL